MNVSNSGENPKKKARNRTIRENPASAAENNLISSRFHTKQTASPGSLFRSNLLVWGDNKTRMILLGGFKAEFLFKPLSGVARKIGQL